MARLNMRYEDNGIMLQPCVRCDDPTTGRINLDVDTMEPAEKIVDRPLCQLCAVGVMTMTMELVSKI